MTTWIKARTWDNFAAQIERENLRRCGRSLTRSSISARMVPDRWIIEVRDDMLFVRDGWRDAMRRVSQA